MFAGTRDDARQAWIRRLPCVICMALGVEQTTHTEVEHFVLKSHGGHDRRDLYPTCGMHRELRHVVLGPKAFTRMLLAQGIDERVICRRLAREYDAEVFPCP